MEVLGQLIEEKCEARSWNLVKSSKSGAVFSHLFFADDLVLFARANFVNCMTIRDVLDDFCARSSQTISESNPGFLSLLMWILTLGNPHVIFWDSGPPPILENILAFPLSILEIITRT